MRIPAVLEGVGEDISFLVLFSFWEEDYVLEAFGTQYGKPRERNTDTLPKLEKKERKRTST